LFAYAHFFIFSPVDNLYSKEWYNNYILIKIKKMENNTINQPNNFDPNKLLPNSSNKTENNNIVINSENANSKPDQAPEQIVFDQPVENQQNSDNLPLVSNNQIEQWVKNGTINEEQAQKMRSSISQNTEKNNTKKFTKVLATIGITLIFLGFAWLLAMNWHQIPSLLKIIILLGSSTATFVFGVQTRQKGRDSVGRALIALGALLYILSVFLIAQIYATSSSLQGYAWLLFLCWPIIAITAYLLDSEENLVISIATFFPWVIIQYFASLEKSNEGVFVFGLIMVFLGAGILLFGLTAFHLYLKHKFANIFRYWTIFYLMIIFFILSFQMALPSISEYYAKGSFSFFLIIFMLISLSGFILGIIFALREKSLTQTEIFGFIAALAVLIILIFSTKIGSGLMGTCLPRSCYDYRNSSECMTAPGSLNCEWNSERNGLCQEQRCGNYRNQNQCISAPTKLNCIWEKNYCRQKSENYGWDTRKYEMCDPYDNQKNKCLSNPVCNWHASMGSSRGLPTSLWLLWIINNIAALGFIIMIIWYGQKNNSAKLVNLAMLAFIGIVISRYIGFMLDLKGYFAFSVLAIIGGVLLILAALYLPKWRRKILKQN
jgi:uncharacterized membrane protein